MPGLSRCALTVSANGSLSVRFNEVRAVARYEKGAMILTSNRGFAGWGDDERVQTFLRRPIEGEWPYRWLDATYVKARRDHHIVSMAVIVAVGVNTDGRREVLGMTIGNSEAEPFWTDFLRSLTRRGLRGVKLVVSDAP